jgi:hypothetical protein
MANSTYPAEFIYDNMMIHGTVVEAAHRYGTRKLLYLGSSCIYPRQATQPIKETELLTGPLEPTNEWYAIAKIAGIKLCQAYRSQYGCDFISRCRPTSTDPATTSTSTPATCCPPSSASSTTRSPWTPGGRDLGNRIADARVPPRRRPRRRLRVPDGALRATTNTSTSAPASICRSATWPNSSGHRPPRRRLCDSTPRSPTARPARCSM